MNSYQITLHKEDSSVQCSPNQTILEATLSAGVNHMHACGGQGKCSTCRVAITEGLGYCAPRNAKEQNIATKLNFPPQIRLACQTTISNDIYMKRMISDEIDMKIVSRQFADKTETSLGSEKELTIVFTDIENYTPFVEQYPPYDVVHMLNRYLLIMNQVIQENHGFISDVAGDGILAVFGYEDPNENSVLEALQAVDEMQKKLAEFNQYLELNYNSNFRIRVGIHYGSVILGPIDTGSMKKLAVIGDNVNMASRVESANKTLNTSVLLSAEAYHQVRNQYPNLKSHQTPLKGKSGQYKLYVVGMADSNTQ